MIILQAPVKVYTIVSAILLCGMLTTGANGQIALNIESASFEGTLHDNLSNKKRQGSGWTPLILKSYPKANLYRDDAVGINFEHIFNGAKAQYDISMFTPRTDTCRLKQIEENLYEIHWPAEGSQWGMEARMRYDVSEEDRVNIIFECTPTVELFSQGFAAMMWASYINCALDRKIHFWGTEGERIGWVAFGENMGKDIEVGTISHEAARNLPCEEEAQSLNLIEHPSKKFITPFYFGFLDGDHDLETHHDKLLYLVLFDQTDPIRFAMWNFFTDDHGNPDTHSPAWDWQYVIRNPKVGNRYGYRARLVVKPFQGTEQIWEEYRRWGKDMAVKLPELPAE